MVNKIDNTKKKLNKRGNPAFHKGMESNNPDGRPAGAKNYLTLLEEALDREAKAAGITYWERLAQYAFTNPKTASAILKKFVPDKIQSDVKVTQVNESLENLTDKEIISKIENNIRRYKSDQKRAGTAVH